LLSNEFFPSQNTPTSMSAGASPQTPLGSLQRSPRSLAGFKGAAEAAGGREYKGRGKKGREGKGRMGKEREKGKVGGIAVGCWGDRRPWIQVLVWLPFVSCIFNQKRMLAWHVPLRHGARALPCVLMYTVFQKEPTLFSLKTLTCVNRFLQFLADVTLQKCCIINPTNAFYVTALPWKILIAFLVMKTTVLFWQYFCQFSFTFNSFWKEDTWPLLFTSFFLLGFGNTLKVRPNAREADVTSM